jgi:hypothetical protein
VLRQYYPNTLLEWRNLSEDKKATAIEHAVTVYVFALDHQIGDILPAAGYSALRSATKLEDFVDWDVQKHVLKRLIHLWDHMHHRFVDGIVHLLPDRRPSSCEDPVMCESKYRQARCRWLQDARFNATYLIQHVAILFVTLGIEQPSFPCPACRDATTSDHETIVQHFWSELVKHA